MDPTIRIGVVAIGVVLIVGAKVLAVAWPHFARSTGSDKPGPSWVSQYVFIAFGVMLIIGGVAVDGAYAILAFVVTLIGLSAIKIVRNIRAGGYGGEE
jgi:hypothetical protein